jgi:hypothetical protein
MWSLLRSYNPPTQAAKAFVFKAFEQNRFTPMSVKEIYRATLAMPAVSHDGSPVKHIPNTGPNAPTAPFPPNPDHPMRSLTCAISLLPTVLSFDADLAPLLPSRYLKHTIIPLLVREGKLSAAKPVIEKGKHMTRRWAFTNAPQPRKPTQAEMTIRSNEQLELSLIGYGEDLSHLKRSLRRKRLAQVAELGAKITAEADREVGKLRNEVAKQRARVLSVSKKQRKINHTLNVQRAAQRKEARRKDAKSVDIVKTTDANAST